MKLDARAPIRWEGSANWWGGAGAMEAALADVLSGRVRIVVDKGFAATSDGQIFLTQVEKVISSRASMVSLWMHDPTRTDLVSVREAAEVWDKEFVDVHVLIGGGSTLDFGLLATLSSDQRELPGFDQGRCGLVLMPATPRRSKLSLRVAIPTTLGTGAEVSSAACVDRTNEKLLVIGSDLRPEVAICDPRATVGLQSRQLREAVIEILARLVVPYASPTQERVHPLAHHLSDDILVGNLRALLRIHIQFRDSDLLGDQERLTLAAVSAHSHIGWVHLGRTPYASPVWFVATELSRVLALSKAAATALLLPSWALAVFRGEICWGDAARLRDLAGRVSLGFEPCAQNDEGWLELLVRELLPPQEVQASYDQTFADQVAKDVANACMRRWGGGLPMLAGLTAQDVQSLVTKALAVANPITKSQTCST